MSDKLPEADGRDLLGMVDRLPDEVLKLLDDYATPELAIRAADRGVEIYSERLAISENPLDARYVWNSALAAAAIRECEARREYPEEGDFSERRVKAVRAAESNYDTLRGLKQSLGAKK